MCIRDRDNCKYLTDNYMKLLKNVMTYVNVQSSANMLFCAIEELLYDQVDISHLSINKSLGSNYKSDTASMLSLIHISYVWSGPASFVSHSQDTTRPNATTAMSGVYTVTVTDGHSCTARCV